MTNCPKCGYIRQSGDSAPDYECPSCGVVYEKFIQHHAEAEAKANDAAERARSRAEHERRQAEKAARKASERALRAQAQAHAQAIAPPKPRRTLGLADVLAVLLVLGVVAAMFAPAAPPAPASAAAAPKPTPVPLTPEQQVAAAEKRQREQAESAAMELCQARVKRAADFPSRIDFNWFGTEAKTVPGGRMAVSVAFTEENALGVELPYMAYCGVSEDGALLSFSVKGR